MRCLKYYDNRNTNEIDYYGNERTIRQEEKMKKKQRKDVYIFKFGICPLVFIYD